MDSVTLKLSSDDAGGQDLLTAVPQYLTGISEHQFASGYVVTGRRGHMKVSVHSHGLKIENSLCKYLLGSNLHTMRRQDVQRAIERLSDELHLPISSATVTRLDFPKNILLKHPVDLYLPYLGQAARCKRFECAGGLSYRVAGRELAFYDKIAELKAAREPIPELYSGRHVLRIEARYLQRAAAYFNRPAITAAALYDEAFYAGICQDWERQYQSIQKLKTHRIDMSAITTKKSLHTLGVIALVQMQGGELAALQEVSERYRTGGLTKKQAFDLRQEIKRCCKGAMQTGRSELIAELDAKAAEAVKFCR